MIMTNGRVIQFAKNEIRRVTEDETIPYDRKKIELDFLQSAIECAKKAIALDNIVEMAEAYDCIRHVDEEDE